MATESEENRLARARRRAAATAGDARKRAAQAAGAATEATRAAGRRAGEAAERGAKVTGAVASAGGRTAADIAAEEIAVNEFIDKRRKARTQSFTERAERVASMAPPTGHTLEILGTAAGVTEMARAGLGVNPEPGVGRETGTEAGAAVGGVDPRVVGPDPTVNPAVSAAVGTGEPDWHDNPDNLDSPDAVRRNLRAAGLDPVDVGSEQEALFGHMLVHKFADEPGLAGRTPHQLEAEHDLAVTAMNEYGAEDRSAMDFEDPFGLVPYDADGGLL